jgi:hypothetical protein
LLTEKIEHAQKEFETEKLMAVIKDAESKLMELRDFGADVTDADAKLKLAKTELEAGKLDRIETIVKEAIEYGERAKLDYIEKKIHAEIESTEKEINKIRNLGVEVKRAADILLDAKRAFDNKAYEEVQTLLKDAHKSASDAERNRRETLARRINDCKTVLGKLRSGGVDVTALEKLLQAATTKCDSRAYLDADKLMSQIEESTKALEHEFLVKRASAIITTVEKLIQEAREVGIDVSQSQSILEQAETAYQAREEETALFFAMKAEKMVKASRVRFFEARAQDMIAKARHEIEDAVKLDIDVTDARKLYNQAETLFNAKTYEKALNYAERARKSVEDVRLGYFDVRMGTLIADAKSKISEIRELGAEVGDAERLLADAEEALKQRAFDKIEELVATAEQSALDSKRAYLCTVAKTQITTAEASIGTLKELGADTTNVDAILAQAREAFDSENYDDAIKLAKECETLAETTRVKFLTDKCEKLLSAATDAVTGAKAVGADVANAEKLLTDAKSALAEQDFERAEQIAIECEKKAVSVKDAYVTNKVSGIIATVQSLLSDMKGSGVEDLESEELIAKAQHAFDNREHEQAMFYAMKAQRAIKISGQRFIIIRASNAIASAQNSILAAKRAGMDVAEPNKLLAEASTAFERHDYDKVIEYAKMVEELTKEWLDKELSVKAFDVIRAATVRLEELTRVGAFKSRVEKLIKDAETFADNKEYDKAIHTAEDAMKDADKIKSEFMQLGKLMKLAETKISSAKARGIDVTKAEDLFEQVKASADNGDYARAMDFARLSVEEAITLELQRYRRAPTPPSPPVAPKPPLHVEEEVEKPEVEAKWEEEEAKEEITERERIEEKEAEAREKVSAEFEPGEEVTRKEEDEGEGKPETEAEWVIADEDIITCSHCNKKIPADSAFCSFCGIEVPK